MTTAGEYSARMIFRETALKGAFVIEPELKEAEAAFGIRWPEAGTRIIATGTGTGRWSNLHRDKRCSVAPTTLAAGSFRRKGSRRESYVQEH